MEKKSFKGNIFFVHQLFIFISYLHQFILSKRATFSKEIVLLERRGLTVFHKIHCLELSLHSMMRNILFWDSRRSDTHLFLCLWKKGLFPPALWFKKRFLILLWIIIALEISALMNEFKISMQVSLFLWYVFIQNFTIN